MSGTNMNFGLFGIWNDIIRLCTGEKVIYEKLDLSLEATTARARYTALWSSTALAYAILFTWLQSHQIPQWLQVQSSVLSVVIIALLAIVMALISGIVGYGLLRIYTLIGHNLTTNLLKVRGQRLRLLSLQTTTLSLSVPFVIAWVIARYVPLLGGFLMLVIGVYAVILLARGYNYIFHVRKVKGLWVLLGGTMLTVFVLCIGALAIAVALAVIWFLVLVVLRGFRH